MKRSLIIELSAGLLILLFTYTALNKLYALQTFNAVLTQVMGVKFLAKMLSVTIPISELIISVGLFFQRSRLFALYASVALLLAFTVYIISMVLFSPNLPCSCGGVLQVLTWKEHIVFNLFFVAIALVAIWMEFRKSKHNDFIAINRNTAEFLR